MTQTLANISFLRYCLGNNEDMSKVLPKIDWHQLYSFALKQTVLGVCFEGISRLEQKYSEKFKQNPIRRERLTTYFN